MTHKVSKRFIDITGLRDIIQRRIPVLIADSKRQGPTVWLTACIHGDEVGGTAIIHDVFSRLKEYGLLRGSVHAYPLVNPMGFENASRFISTDREDLNRCFPGDSRGSMGQQIARRLFDTIMKSEPDLLIDIHNDWIQSVPYLLVEPQDTYPTKKLFREVLELASASHLLLVEDSAAHYSPNNTLAGALVEAGVPAYTFEAGGAYAVVEEGVTAGVNAVMSTLQELGMIGPGYARPDQAVPDQWFRYSNQPLCTTSGLIRFAVQPGQEVQKGQILATVYGAFGSREETLRATADGFVLGLEDHARVLPGREVVAIAERP